MKCILAGSLCLVLALAAYELRSIPNHRTNRIRAYEVRKFQIIKEGKQAALKGLPNTDNPYLNPYASLSPQESTWWFQGWLEVYKESERVKWGL